MGAYSVYGPQAAGISVHHISGHADALGHQRVMLYQIDRFSHGCVSVVKAVELVAQIYAAVLHEGNVLVADATLAHEL